MKQTKNTNLLRTLAVTTFTLILVVTVLGPYSRSTIAEPMTEVFNSWDQTQVINAQYDVDGNTLVYYTIDKICRVNLENLRYLCKNLPLSFVLGEFVTAGVEVSEELDVVILGNYDYSTFSSGFCSYDLETLEIQNCGTTSGMDVYDFEIIRKGVVLSGTYDTEISCGSYKLYAADLHDWSGPIRVNYMDMEGFDITNYSLVSGTSVSKADCYKDDVYTVGYLLSNGAGPVTFLPEVREVHVSSSGQVAHTDPAHERLYVMDLETKNSNLITTASNISALGWGEDMVTYYNGDTHEVVTVDLEGYHISNASFVVSQEQRVEEISWTGQSMIVLVCLGEMPNPTEDCTVSIYQ